MEETSRTKNYYPIGYGNDVGTLIELKDSTIAMRLIVPFRDFDKKSLTNLLGPIVLPILSPIKKIATNFFDSITQDKHPLFSISSSSSSSFEKTSSSSSSSSSSSTTPTSKQKLEITVSNFRRIVEELNQKIKLDDTTIVNFVNLVNLNNEKQRPTIDWFIRYKYNARELFHYIHLADERGITYLSEKKKNPGSKLPALFVLIENGKLTLEHLKLEGFMDRDLFRKFVVFYNLNTSKIQSEFKINTFAKFSEFGFDAEELTWMKVTRNEITKTWFKTEIKYDKLTEFVSKNFDSKDVGDYFFKVLGLKKSEWEKMNGTTARSALVLNKRSNKTNATPDKSAVSRQIKKKVVSSTSIVQKSNPPETVDYF